MVGLLKPPTMDSSSRFRQFALPAIFLMLFIGNYSRIGGSEAIRPVVQLTLLGIGGCLAILGRNLVALMRKP